MANEKRALVSALFSLTISYMVLSTHQVVAGCCAYLLSSTPAIIFDASARVALAFGLKTFPG